MQKKLNHLVNFTVRNYSESKKLRGVAANWEKDSHTLYLTFYFNGPISEEDIEDAQDVGSGIISHFPDGFLEDCYVRWDYPNRLPEDFLAYNIDEHLKNN